MKSVPKFQTGYTLTELIIVVTILGIIAAIAVPATSSSTDSKLDLAASEFAAAMRFARSESIRTGAPHGFHQKSDNKRIRVFRLDTGTDPATLIYDIYHPIDKSLYDYDIDLESLVATESITRTTVYRGTCNQKNQVYFDSNGTPWCSDPTSVLLESFDLTFLSGSSQRIVTLDRVTGRVTVQ